MSASLSKSEWDHWCNELGETHQTKIGFCRDNNLKNHQFLYWLKQTGVIEQIAPRVNTPVNRLTITHGSREIRSRRRLMPIINTAHDSESEILLRFVLFSIAIAALLQENQDPGNTSSFNTRTETALSVL